MSTSTTAGSAVHVIDAENLLGSPTATPAAIAHLWSTYRAQVTSTPRDQIRVGASGLFASRAAGVFAHQHVRLLVRDGVDGADDALIESIDTDHLARRFDRLVIASGDGAFAPLALAARERGVDVTLVTGLSACSRALVAAAGTPTRLPLLLRPADVRPVLPRRSRGRRLGVAA